MRTIARLILLASLLAPAVPASAGDGAVLIDDFEGGPNATQTAWSTAFDKNGLGTKLSPDPFVVEKDGAPGSPKGSAHIWGHYGKNVAPYPWAQLTLPLDVSQSPVDLSFAKGVRFWVKGKGGRGRLILVREAVKDWADYQFEFTAPEKWTLLTVPFADFTQPDWGKKVPALFDDVKELKFSPSVNEADFDFSIDDFAFLPDPASKDASPFKPMKGVTELPLKQLLAKKSGLTFVDLAAAANRNFKDDQEADGKGGWTDQGTNSVYGMPAGRQVMEGIPFEISAKPDKQCLVLRGQGHKAYPLTADIPVGAKAKAVYFLHSAPWANGLVGTYRIVYSDGTSTAIPLRANIEVFDWWTAASSPVCRVGWKGANPQKDPIGLSLFAWENPEPGKVIEKITAGTEGSGAFLCIAGITLSDEGPALVKMEPKVYPVKDWFAYPGVDVKKRAGTALDMSRLLDAPAGKHGWLMKRSGEDFVFSDGTTVKFFGVNVVASANFPTKERAEWMADLLAQSGVNMTRHHHMDADWSNRNLFGKKDGTLDLDPESMDRLDYLISRLQKRGIYQYLDLLVHRRPFESDGIAGAADVPYGYKIHGEFAPKLIELQERFITQFLGHQNPYTGKRYGEDPALCLMEIINEDSLFFRSGDEGETGLKDPYYRGLWNGLFNDYLVRTYGTRAKLAARWAPKAGDKGEGLGKSENPAKKSVKCIGSWRTDERKKYSRRRQLDTFLFYYDLTLKYFRRIEGVVRKAGSRALMTGSNHWTDVPADLYANAQMDYLDRHNYWAHPSGGWGYNPDVTFEPSSMVKNSQGGIIGPLAWKRVKGMPYIVTEWQAAAPNDYRVEGVFFMGLYCAFQNWSAVQFAFSHSDSFGEKLENNFDIHNQPAMLAAWPAMALLVHRGDVRSPDDGTYQPMSDASVFDPDFRSSAPPALGLVAKTGIEFTGTKEKKADLDAVVDRQMKGLRATSTTGEIVLDRGQGFLAVDTARSQGFTGFGEGKTLAFKNLEATVKNEYALVAATSLDEQPLSEASSILVTAAANAINTGQELAPEGNRLKNVGTTPVLVEPVVGKVVLKGLAGELKKAQVWALDPSGVRTGKVPVTTGDGILAFELKSRYQCMHYEVVR